MYVQNSDTENKSRTILMGNLFSEGKLDAHRREARRNNKRDAPSVHYKNISAERPGCPFDRRRRKRNFIIPRARPTECSLRRSRCSNTYCTHELDCVRARARAQMCVCVRVYCVCSGTLASDSPAGTPLFLSPLIIGLNTECAFAFLFLSPNSPRFPANKLGAHVRFSVSRHCLHGACCSEDAAFSPRWIAELRAYQFPDWVGGMLPGIVCLNYARSEKHSLIHQFFN